MSEFNAAAKFIAWIAAGALSWGVIGSLGKMVLPMAKAAMEAQLHDQISYGQYSRMLWSKPHTHK